MFQVVDMPFYSSIYFYKKQKRYKNHISFAEGEHIEFAVLKKRKYIEFIFWKRINISSSFFAENEHIDKKREAEPLAFYFIM